MPKEKSLILHPRPYQAQPKRDASWIVVSQDASKDDFLEFVTSWSYAACSKVGGYVKTDEIGAEMGVEALLMKLRGSFVDLIYMTDEDWGHLKSEAEKPVVPLHQLISEVSLKPTNSTEC